ncbi:MAG: GlsB/YeaQ/YmgE family stress response membrane protein [Candidatus Doudnabacteria bacterium]|nr:GlsB/YeaQ/YmgE family stress response membrane protein [Candidatus Doudnabacteria bacterium]
MNLLLWIVFGGLAGWVASLIVGQDASMGLVANILVGIAGAMLGGWLADKLGVGSAPGAERPTGLFSFFIAVVGAILVLAVVNLIF